MNWKPGLKAVCVRNMPWRDNDTGDLVFDGPVRDTVYLVEHVFAQSCGVGLALAGFPGWWDADEFRPLIPASERAKETADAQ